MRKGLQSYHVCRPQWLFVCSSDGIRMDGVRLLPSAIIYTCGRSRVICEPSEVNIRHLGQRAVAAVVLLLDDDADVARAASARSAARRALVTPRRAPPRPRHAAPRGWSRPPHRAQLAECGVRRVAYRVSRPGGVLDDIPIALRAQDQRRAPGAPQRAPPRGRPMHRAGSVWNAAYGMLRTVTTASPAAYD